MIPPIQSHQLFCQVSSQNMGLVVVLSMIVVVLMGALLSLALEHIWLSVREWLKRRRDRKDHA